MQMGELVELGVPWEVVRTHTPDEVVAFLDGMVTVRAKRAAADRPAVD